MGSDNIQKPFVHCEPPLFSGSESEIPTQPLPDTMKFPLASSPSLSFNSCQSEFEFKGGVKSEPAAAAGESSLGAPKPLELLHETPIPPFLSKTYDLVDDVSLDYIISWGERGYSFVVWEPVEFARMILPKHFKHNNFSSFVRQLNTYGFRKIDSDKWEFANEGFVRGQRHLLKKIQRRKSHQFQQFGSSSGSSNEAGKAALEGEIKALRKERSSMLQEVVEMQHQQLGTTQHIEAVKEKLEAAERRQKQMVSFLAKICENPAFLARLSQPREQKSITSPRTKRKFINHQLHELGTSSSSPKGHIVKYEPEFCNLTMPCVTSETDPVAFKQFCGHSLQDTRDGPPFSADHVPSQVDYSGQDELAMVNELLHTPEKGESVRTLETTNPLVEQRVGTKSQPQPANQCFISSPGDFVTEKSIPEFSIAVNESMVTEDAWSMASEAAAAAAATGAGMSATTTEPLGYLSNNNVPDLGVCSELPDIWDIGSLQLAGSSGIERWLDEDYPVN